eukprot:scaffold27594_cov48-Attheya_sp.AAC.14
MTNNNNVSMMVSLACIVAEDTSAFTVPNQRLRFPNNHRQLISRWIHQRGGTPRSMGAWTYSCMGRLSPKFPSAIHSWRMLQSLQQEWKFLQHVTDGIVNEFQAVESSLKDDSSLLSWDRARYCHTEPNHQCQREFPGLHNFCGHLVASLRKRAMFNGTENTSVIKEGQSAIRISRVAVDDGEWKHLLRNLPQET